MLRLVEEKENVMLDGLFGGIFAALQDVLAGSIIEWITGLFSGLLGGLGGIV